MIASLLGANTSAVHAAGWQRFNATAAAQQFVVPAGVSEISVRLSGAAGGGSTGGRGGYVSARLAVVAGQVLQVMVGGRGTNSGGWNGGADPGVPGGGAVGQNVGGGGASDIRVGACAQTLSCGFDDRVLVGGGGGGADAATATVGVPIGGAAGHPDGEAGTDGAGSGGYGATSMAPGAGGDAADVAGTDGAAGATGAGGQGGDLAGAAACAGAGGGGGWFGGGGGGSDVPVCTTGGAGGGGSSHAEGVGLVDVDFATGSPNEGWVEISPASATVPAPTTAHATAVTGSTATVHGAIANVSSATDVSFVVSEAEVFESGTWHSMGSVTSSQEFALPLTNLSAGETYSVWLVAEGEFGRVLSVPTDFTLAGVPDQPHTPVGTPSSNRATVRVSWLPVAGNGTPVTSYRVTAQPSGRACVAPGAARSCIVTGLPGVGPYTFDVTATNSVGISDASPRSVGVNPNLKGVTVRVLAPRWATQRRLTRIGVRVPGGYRGVAMVSFGQRRFCVATVRNGAGSCVGRSAFAGRRALAVMFRGNGIDRDTTGSTLTTLLVKPTQPVLRRDLCAVPGAVGQRIRTLTATTCGGSR